MAATKKPATKKPAAKKAATTVAPAAEAPPGAKEPATEPKRSLALRLLGKLAELSRRGDVTVT